MKKDFLTDKGIVVRVNFPDKCPYCGKDFALANGNRSFDWGHLYYAIASCIHCNEPVIAILDMRNGKTIHSFPSSAFISVPNEIKDLSPTACSIYEQALQARSLGLDHLVGPGLRMTLEWLIWDYLTKIKNVPEEELKDKSLKARVDYLGEDNYKLVCANIVRVFGNDEIHLFKNYNIDVDDAIKVLNALLNNIYAELIIKRVNEQLS